MTQGIITRLLVVAFITITLFGCVSPGQDSFKLAQDLERQGRIEEAIAVYQDALSKEPDNPEYKASLKKAQEAVASKYLDRARNTLSKQPLLFNDLRSAQNDIDSALKVAPESSEARQLSERVKTELTTLTKRAETLYAQSAKSADANDWQSAISALNEIKSFYPNYLDVPIRQTIYQNNAIEYYLKEASKSKALEDWESVIKLMASAQMIKTDNAQVNALMQEARTKHTATYYTSKAEESLKAGNLQAVLSYADKASKLPADPATTKKLNDIKAQVGKTFVSQADSAFQAKKFYESATLLQSAVVTLPALRKDPQFADLAEQLIITLITEADQKDANGHLEMAYVLYDKALQLSGNRRDLLSKTQAIKDRIKQKVIKKIAVMDFTAPSNNADAGRLFTDSLLSYLTKNTTADVKILARDVLGSILKEIELGQAGLSELESAKKAGKLKGTDVFIFGNVLLYNVEKNTQESQKSVNVVVGKKMTPNPAYQHWMMLNPNPKEEDLKKAPPQFIDEEVRETVRYKVGTQKKIATVSVSYRVIDVEEGEMVITDTLRNKKEVEDTYSEGVEFANIPFDPLQLPSDSELLDKVVEATVAELGYKVLSRFQNLQMLYSNQAEIARKKGDYEKAIEKFVDAIHVEELKNLYSPVSENAKKEIDKLIMLMQ